MTDSRAEASFHGRSSASRGGGADTNAASGRPALRADRDPPEAVARLGWRYHHTGIPTRTPRPGEKYLRDYGMYVSGFDASPFGIEWMRFEPTCSLPPLVKTVAHVAFEVDDLEAALRGRRVIVPPGSPSDGVRSAMIADNGAPVELLEFSPPRAGMESQT